MANTENNPGMMLVISAFAGFFVMGFVDFVGIATNFVKHDFSLSGVMANFIPMMVFIWFAVFSIPAGVLMGKIGKKKTILLSFVVSGIALIIPYFVYTFQSVLISFALLGISNTVLQVSLNPMVASIFDREKTASVLTAGQFIKSISSLLGPIIAGVSANYFFDWKVSFIIFSVISLVASLLLLFSEYDDHSISTEQTSVKNTLLLLKDKYILLCFLSILFIVGLDIGVNTTAPEFLVRKMNIDLSNSGIGSSTYFAAKTLGTFVGAFLLLKFSPLKFLKLSLYIGVASIALLLVAPNLWLSLLFIFLIGLACANVFSIIFSYALQQKQDQTNEVSALMIMGVSGGAVILPLLGLINDLMGLSAAFVLLALCLVAILLFTKNFKEYGKA